MIAGPMLQPGAPSAAASGATWLLRCAAADGAPECLVDGDGDGFPAAGDCDDSDPNVHPGQPPIVDGTGTDYDCDGWTWP